jgi:hypothetical protein
LTFAAVVQEGAMAEVNERLVLKGDSIGGVIVAIVFLPSVLGASKDFASLPL